MMQKTEEKQTGFSQKPINVFFTPVSINIPFKQKVTLQIAFYRGNKISKTKPAKYNTKTQNQQIKLTEEKLQFCTKICFNNEKCKFQTKKISVQVAYNADDVRQQLNGTLNLKNYLELKPEILQEKVELVFPNQITLTLSLQIIFTDGLPEVKERQQEEDIIILKKENSKKSSSKFKQENTSKPDKIISGRSKRINKSNSLCQKNSFKVIQNQSNNQDEQCSNKNSKKQKSRASCFFIAESEKHSKQTEKQNENNHKSEKEMNNKKNKNKISNFCESKQSEGNIPNSSFLLKQNEKLNKKLSQLDHKYKVKEYQMEELQKKYQKITKDENGQNSKQNQIIFQKKNSQIKKLEETISHCLAKESVLLKSEREWKEKYQQAERKNNVYSKELNENNVINQNLKKQNKSFKEKICQIQAKYQQQVQIYENDRRRSEENKDSQEKFKKQIEILKKQLENKDKMLNFLKTNRQNSASRTKDVERLVKQNFDLKEQIHKKQCEQINMKVENETLRKDNEHLKKCQKSLLHQKSSQRTQIVHCQEELIKLKQVMMNILNMIQRQSFPLYESATEFLC